MRARCSLLLVLLAASTHGAGTIVPVSMEVLDAIQVPYGMQVHELFPPWPSRNPQAPATPGVTLFTIREFSRECC